MPEPTKRPRYFDGQLLGTEDFALDQSYDMSRRRLHNRLLHGWGIARGLALNFVAGAATATVTAGEAFDGLGRELVLASDAITPDISNQPNSTLFVTLSYAEVESDSRAMGGRTGNARFNELPTIAVSTAAPADPSVQLILGRLIVGANGRIASRDDGVDPLRRRTLGAAVGVPAGSDLSVRNLIASGNIGIGVTSASTRLHIAGGGWDVTNSDGDLKIGDNNYRLRIGVALAGSGAGDARIRAVGGTNRLMLGGGTADTLTIANANVGIRNIYPTYALDVTGDIHFTGNLIGGGKGGFVMDRFINRAGRSLERGEVVVIASRQDDLFEGPDGAIPVPVVETTSAAEDSRVCGLVYAPVQGRDGETVPVGSLGWMVTLGAFNRCKVDASAAEIRAGDLLVSSPRAGFAQRALDPAQSSGAVIGKALGSLGSGQGVVPILVTLR